MAALGRITVYHKDGTSQTVDYSRLGVGEVPDFKLEDGDRVQVPQNPNRILVTGAVANPGPYAIPEGGTLTLSEALIAAGNTSPGARLNDIVVLHQVPVTKKNPEGYEGNP